MRPFKPLELKFILALLPLFIEGAPFLRIFSGIVFCIFSVFGSVQFFTLTKPLFPKNFLTPALVLLIATVYQTANYFIELPALWIVSFFLLFDWNDVDPNRLGAKSLPFWPRLASFAGFGIALALIREILTHRLGAIIFNEPAGTLTVFALGAALYPRALFLKRNESADV